jgi:hypothetical protein
LLSAEIVGRSYGGGVLKLEPTEAEALLVPPLLPAAGSLRVVDEAIRSRDIGLALDLVDELTLVPLGLTQSEIGDLRGARQQLRERRRRRSRPPAAR